jgi:hypothetical protein
MRKSWIVSLALSGALAAGVAQSATYTEAFEGDFPAWESDWFGTLSDARNYYCFGALGCDQRGNNPDGQWISNTAGGSSGPVTVTFDGGFAASLVSFSIDVAGATVTTLTATDKDGAEIFSQPVALTFGYGTDPGVYTTYVITSTNGIDSFSFSGAASGNTSVDNLVSMTTAVPEPATALLMLAGAAGLALRARRT